MKFKINLFILYFLMILVIIPQSNQNQRTRSIRLTGGCSFNSKVYKGTSIYTFATDRETMSIVDEIIYQTGLKMNFTVSATNVSDALAGIEKVNGKEERFIYYNQGFLDEVKRGTGTKWSKYSIMAHEIGHHLQGHTVEKIGSEPTSELEADEWSGFMLYKLGASLEEAQASVNLYASEEETRTHPAREARLAAIYAGWKRSEEVSGGVISPQSGGGGVPPQARLGERISRTVSAWSLCRSPRVALTWVALMGTVIVRVTKNPSTV